jgi:hypothetical protein
MLHQRLPPIESEALRRSAAGEECTLHLPGICNWRTDTTVLAHIYVGPKAMGGKGDDIHACFACCACHEAIDRYWADDRYEYLLGGLIKTQQVFIRNGLLLVPSATVEVYARPSKILPRRGVRV